MVCDIGSYALALDRDFIKILARDVHKEQEMEDAQETPMIGVAKFGQIDSIV